MTTPCSVATKVSAVSIHVSVSAGDAGQAPVAAAAFVTVSVRAISIAMIKVSAEAAFRACSPACIAIDVYIAISVRFCVRVIVSA